MSPITIVMLVVGYLVLVAFVLVLLTAARDAGDTAELEPRTVAAPDAPLRLPDEDAGEVWLTPDDAAFLERHARRAGREIAGVAHRARRNHHD